MDDQIAQKYIYSHSHNHNRRNILEFTSNNKSPRRKEHHNEADVIPEKAKSFLTGFYMMTKDIDFASIVSTRRMMVFLFFVYFCVTLCLTLNDGTLSERNYTMFSLVLHIITYLLLFLAGSNLYATRYVLFLLYGICLSVSTSMLIIFRVASYVVDISGIVANLPVVGSIPGASMAIINTQKMDTLLHTIPLCMDIIVGMLFHVDISVSLYAHYVKGSIAEKIWAVLATIIVPLVVFVVYAIFSPWSIYGSDPSGEYGTVPYIVMALVSIAVYLMVLVLLYVYMTTNHEWNTLIMYNIRKYVYRQYMTNPKFRNMIAVQLSATTWKLHTRSSTLASSINSIKRIESMEEKKKNAMADIIKDQTMRMPRYIGYEEDLQISHDEVHSMLDDEISIYTMLDHPREYVTPYQDIFFPYESDEYNRENATFDYIHEDINPMDHIESQMNIVSLSTNNKNKKKNKKAAGPDYAGIHDPTSSQPPPQLISENGSITYQQDVRITEDSSREDFYRDRFVDMWLSASHSSVTRIVTWAKVSIVARAILVGGFGMLYLYCSFLQVFGSTGISLYTYFTFWALTFHAVFRLIFALLFLMSIRWFRRFVSLFYLADIGLSLGVYFTIRVIINCDPSSVNITDSSYVASLITKDTLIHVLPVVDSLFIGLIFCYEISEAMYEHYAILRGFPFTDNITLQKTKKPWVKSGFSRFIVSTLGIPLLMLGVYNIIFDAQVVYQTTISYTSMLCIFVVPMLSVFPLWYFFVIFKIYIFSVMQEVEARPIHYQLQLEAQQQQQQQQSKI